MMTRRLIAAAALLAAAGLSAPAHAQQTIRLTAAAGHPPVFLWVKLVDEFFIPEVDKRLAAAGNQYKVEWTKAWGGTLIKLGAESKASPTAWPTWASSAPSSRRRGSPART
jgi:ABC-type sugar transport system substrate-binding protein